MRALVFSDSHGRGSRVEAAILEQENVKHVFFLGDRVSDIEHLPELYPDVNFYTVPGNCDFSFSSMHTKSVTLCGRKIIYTHGHAFSVKSGTERLIAYARAAGADIILYGHTHLPETTYLDGLYVVNPGSIGKGQRFDSYATIDIENSGIFANIVKI
jgi:putative phosphoesterase